MIMIIMRYVMTNSRHTHVMQSVTQHFVRFTNFAKRCNWRVSYNALQSNNRRRTHRAWDMSCGYIIGLYDTIIRFLTGICTCHMLSAFIDLCIQVIKCHIILHPSQLSHKLRAPPLEWLIVSVGASTYVLVFIGIYWYLYVSIGNIW